MAGSIPLSLNPQFDDQGNLLAGGQAYFIQAGTVGTPQNAFQDGSLTLPWPNPYTLPASGRLPLLYFADGYIKVRIVDSNGVQVFNQDNIPVTGFSSGGGGGGTIDPTTVLQTGWLVPIYGTGIVSGFVRANARTIGNASSGATERANADTSALFVFLYNADTNLAVSGGRGASAAADYAANKTIALPDFRGRALAGLDDMGNSAAGRLTASYFGTTATVLGAAGGSESKVVAQANLPAVNFVVAAGQTISAASANTYPNSSVTLDGPGGAVGSTYYYWKQGASTATAAIASTGTVTSTGSAASGGSSTPVAVASPMILATIYMKL